MDKIKKDRRAHVRIDFQATVELVVGRTRYKTTLHDISLNGALVSVPEDWRLPDSNTCTLMLSLSSEDPVLMFSEIVWIDNSNIGLRCKSIDLDSISRLRRLVELNLGDQTLLERELEALTHDIHA